MSKKKVERVTVKYSEVFSRAEVVYYRLSCGCVFNWVDIFPPTFCPFCGRMIDYAGPEEGEQ